MARLTYEQARAIQQGAGQLGIDPAVLASVISYETGGKFSTDIMGGKGGTYQGLIQFSPDNQKRYGIKKNMTFPEQMGSVVQYLKDRGVKPGMGLTPVYSAINAGNADKKYWNRSDGYGNQMQHAAKIKAGHLPKMNDVFAMMPGYKGDAQLASAAASEGAPAPAASGNAQQKTQGVLPQIMAAAQGNADPASLFGKIQGLLGQLPSGAPGPAGGSQGQQAPHPGAGGGLFGSTGVSPMQKAEYSMGRGLKGGPGRPGGAPGGQGYAPTGAGGYHPNSPNAGFQPNAQTQTPPQEPALTPHQQFTRDLPNTAQQPALPQMLQFFGGLFS